jgi:hypothetical protein
VQGAFGLQELAGSIHDERRKLGFKVCGVFTIVRWRLLAHWKVQPDLTTVAKQITVQKNSNVAEQKVSVLSKMRQIQCQQGAP